MPQVFDEGRVNLSCIFWNFVKICKLVIYTLWLLVRKVFSINKKAFAMSEGFNYQYQLVRQR